MRLELTRQILPLPPQSSASTNSATWTITQGPQTRQREWSEKRDSNPRPRPWQGRALPTELFSHFTIYSFEKPSCQGRILLFRGGQGRALPTELFSHFTIHSFEKPSCQGRILLFRGQGRALPTELFSRSSGRLFSLFALQSYCFFLNLPNFFGNFLNIFVLLPYY